MKNRKTLHWIYKNTRSYLPAVGLIAVLSAAVSVGYILLAYFSSYVIDIATGQKSGNITLYIGLLFGLILLQAVLYVLNSSLRVRVTGKIEMALKGQMFLSLTQKEYSGIAPLHSGDILNRFTSDVEVVVGGVVGIVPSAVSLFSRLIAALAVLISMSPELTVVIIIIGIVVGFAARIYSKYFKGIHKKVQSAMGETRSYMQECTENIVVVKTFGSAGTFHEKLKSLMTRVYKLKLRRNLISNIANIAVFLLFTGGYYAALSWGAFMVDRAAITYGTLTALLSIVSQVRAPITNMSGLIPQYYSALASAERIMELQCLPDEPKTLPQTDTARLYEKLSAVRLQNVSFRYGKKNNEVLKSADMTLKKGTLTALVGGSGEGKSTIFRLLLGLYHPNEGTLFLKTDEETIPIDATVRGLFAYVPQGNMILSGTIAENIRFCNLSADDEALLNAAKCADLYDFVQSLPNGFDTVIGERGLGLSEGQIQRISIARAVLSGAPILLLDECTSSLDEKTEKTVLQNIKAMTDRTVLIISHRPAALSVCDKIYRLSGGILRVEE